MNCPACGTALQALSRHGVDFWHCPACGGAWLDRAAIGQLADVLPAPVEAPGRPQAKRFEDRAPGAGAGHGTRFGGEFSRVKPEPPKRLVDDIFTPEGDG